LAIYPVPEGLITGYRVTNPSDQRGRLESGTSEYKFSVLTTRPRRLSYIYSNALKLLSTLLGSGKKLKNIVSSFTFDTFVLEQHWFQLNFQSLT